MDTESSCLVRSRRHDAPAARISADDYGLPAQRWVSRLLHRDEESVKVYVQYAPRHLA
jgi:hypothetical protein